MKNILKIISFCLCFCFLMPFLQVSADPSVLCDQEQPPVTEETPEEEAQDPNDQIDSESDLQDSEQEDVTDKTESEDPEPEEPVQYPIYVIPEKQPYKETLKYWLNEQKDSIVLIGDPSVDIVIIADSQVGYVASCSRYMIPEEGSRRKEYSRYGDFMGRPYCDWCDAFVSFCVYYAGLTDYPLEISCLRHEIALKKEGYFREWCQYIPNPGDIVFLSLTEDSHTVTHVGIVEYVEKKHGEAPVLHTIEGNICVDGINVARCERSFDDVIGYGTYTKGEKYESPKQTWRQDNAKKIPIDENHRWFSFPTPDKKIVSYIKGSGLSMFNRLYPELAAEPEVVGAQKQPETATEIKPPEDNKQQSVDQNDKKNNDNHLSADKRVLKGGAVD